ncbi:MAG: hypothetical protein RL605_995 [Actinomycetota bacterium]
MGEIVSTLFDRLLIDALKSIMNEVKTTSIFNDLVPFTEEVMMSVSIKPLEDRIVVRPVEAEQVTASGLVIPDTAKEKPQEAEVIAVGPGRIDDKGNRVPVDVAVGDKVIFSKYGGTELKFGGQEYLILSARDVLAVVVR